MSLLYFLNFILYLSFYDEVLNMEIDTYILV